MNKVMVIGAGQMGGGIAQVAATAGLHVYVFDLNLEQAQQSVITIERSTDYAYK